MASESEVGVKHNQLTGSVVVSVSSVQHGAGLYADGIYHEARLRSYQGKQKFARNIIFSCLQ